MLTSKHTGSQLRLHLIVPGLIGKIVQRAQGVRDFPRYRHIEWLLSKARHRMPAIQGYERQLCSLVGFQIPQDQDVPVGALRHYGLTSSAKEAFYLCADPVHLRADLHQLILLDSSKINIEQQESQALIELFNAHFQEEGYRLESDLVDQWHLCLPEPEVIRTYSLRQVRGNDINAYLPSGKRALIWQRLLNEVQMLYHTAAPNRLRESVGALPINSLWFYGGGALPQPISGQWSALWSDDLMVRGLCRLADIKCHTFPQSLQTFLETNPTGEHLICIDELAISSSYDELQTWYDHMEQLERNWFAPLINAMKRRRIEVCTIIEPNGQQFTLQGISNWQFWRQPKPLFDYVLNTP